eukprot:2134983-Alexandrium_andersonii.AAC.1
MDSVVGLSGISPASKARPSAWASPCTAAPAAVPRAEGPARARQVQTELRTAGSASGTGRSEKGNKKLRKADGRCADLAAKQ